MDGSSALIGFPRRLENLENENGHSKVMEHEKLTKIHGILWSVMEFYQIVPNLSFLVTTMKSSIDVEGAFSDVFRKML